MAWALTIPSCLAHQEMMVDLLHILGFVAVLSIAHWETTVDPRHVVGSVAISNLARWETTVHCFVRLCPPPR